MSSYFPLFCLLLRLLSLRRCRAYRYCLSVQCCRFEHRCRTSWKTWTLPTESSSDRRGPTRTRGSPWVLERRPGECHSGIPPTRARRLKKIDRDAAFLSMERCAVDPRSAFACTAFAVPILSLSELDHRAAQLLRSVACSECVPAGPALPRGPRLSFIRTPPSVSVPQSSFEIPLQCPPPLVCWPFMLTKNKQVRVGRTALTSPTAGPGGTGHPARRRLASGGRGQRAPGGGGAPPSLGCRKGVVGRGWHDVGADQTREVGTQETVEEETGGGW